MRAAALVLLALSSCSQITGAFDKRQFNLVCDGSKNYQYGFYPAKSEKLHEVYRIDLANMRYCKGPCDQTEKLTSVSPSEIEQHIKGSFDSDDQLTFQRETGDWNYKSTWNGGYVFIGGSCKKTAFSGFPSAKF
ncbi:hypothetical protein [Sphingomonas sp. 10B4]|uniref:hypothetical protein n=1 Tax=Sphingomonas sp. 10B4 TaxID=3048575 RepID=UPI002AB5CD2C|nr:hypothetical protein [Sphingomonas sp. 10B4]MDY7525857.1 hypothetical protein [Sphingomonas sp. 10B4]MEB0284404.1 hypothetical protein [Sphingomonas sp. 10B4]